MDKHASQYKGGRQHDAQEFLLWLLDQVHEDLNLANRRRHRLKSVNSGGGSNGATSEVRSDEVLAADALAAYMRSNNSFVVDVFQVIAGAFYFVRTLFLSEKQIFTLSQDHSHCDRCHETSRLL